MRSDRRIYAAGVYDPLQGFVVTGGYDNGALATAERTYDGVQFSPFPTMPSGAYGHCLVSLNNGDLFAVDGNKQKTFMYRGSTNSWSSLNSLGSVQNGIMSLLGTLKNTAIVEIFLRNQLRSYRRKWPSHRDCCSWRKGIRKRFHLQPCVWAMAADWYILELLGFGEVTSSSRFM